MKRSWIETFSESLGIIPKISDRPDWSEKMEGPRELYKYPDPTEWDDFIELDPLAWPEKRNGIILLCQPLALIVNQPVVCWHILIKIPIRSGSLKAILTIRVVVEETAPRVRQRSTRSMIRNVFFIR